MVLRIITVITVIIAIITIIREVNIIRMLKKQFTCKNCGKMNEYISNQCKCIHCGKGTFKVRNRTIKHLITRGKYTFNSSGKDSYTENMMKCKAEITTSVVLAAFMICLLIYRIYKA